MNRYDVASVAKFSPLSFQELSAAPLMQRQKHDQLIAQQEMLRQNLAKTNPHEKYFDEAVRLKNDLNNQITSQAELLSKEGVNPNSQAEFLKLNRDYQETMSPTGKLGMINAHNVNLQSTYKNYIDEAIKAGQSPAIAKLHADQAIQKHMKDPLYDEKGRVVDFSAGNAAPKYIDNVKWINELANKVGFTQSNWANASSGISKTADGRFVVNESAKGMTKDNIENLNRLAQAANREVLDPVSEIRQNIDYNFKNPQTELDNMLNQLYARRERESGITDRNKSYGSVDWNDNTGNGYLGIPSTIYDPSTQKTLTSEVKDTDYSKIGTNKSTTSGVPGQFAQNTQKVKIGYKDLLRDPIAQKLYEKSYDKLVAKKKIPKGADKNSNEVAKIVGFYMKNHVNVPSIANDIILPDTATNSQQFMGEFDRKTGSDRDATANSNLNNGYRTIIDPISGKELSPEEFRNKGYSVKYIGYDDMLGYNNYKFKGDNNKNQSVLTHKVEVLDDKGKSLGQTAMTRSKQEMESPEFKKAYQIAHVYRNTINNFDDWVTPSATDNFKVKFKPNGRFDIEYNGNLYENATGQDYKFMIGKAISEKQ